MMMRLLCLNPLGSTLCGRESLYNCARPWSRWRPQGWWGWWWWWRCATRDTDGDNSVNIPSKRGLSSVQAQTYCCIFGILRVWLSREKRLGQQFAKWKFSAIKRYDKFSSHGNCASMLYTYTHTATDATHRGFANSILPISKKIAPFWTAGKICLVSYI